MAFQRNYFLAIAAAFGALGVAMGAFGAHALKPKLLELETLEVWKTAVAYQMWHALLLGFLAKAFKQTQRYFIHYCLIFGILFFSGSLYWLALGGPAWLGPVTPLGGLLLMLSWLMLIKTALWNSQQAR